MNETTNTRESIPPYLSKKIRLLSFFTIICVVFIHAYNYHDVELKPMTALYEGFQICPMIQFFISNALTRFANPLYFFISGYLFFAGARRFNASVYAKKLKKRLVTLMLPYCIWVLAWSAAGILIVNYCKISFPVIDEKIGLLRDNALKAFFSTPLPFQFWYIADLFKLAILSPIVYLLVKKLKIFAVILAAIPWIFNYSVPYMPNCDGILFFVLGAYLAVNCIRFPGKERPVKKTAMTIAVPVIWIAVCAAYTLLSAYESTIGASSPMLLFMYKMCGALGFISVFIIYDAASARIEKSRALAALSSCTFFIYACHEPLQHMIFQRVLEFTDSNFVHMALFFGLPLVFAAFGAAAGGLLRKAAPRVHSVLTGGRG